MGITWQPPVGYGYINEICPETCAIAGVAKPTACCQDTPSTFTSASAVVGGAECSALDGAFFAGYGGASIVCSMSTGAFSSGAAQAGLSWAPPTGFSATSGMNDVCPETCAAAGKPATGCSAPCPTEFEAARPFYLKTAIGGHCYWSSSTTVFSFAECPRVCGPNASPYAFTSEAEEHMVRSTMVLDAVRGGLYLDDSGAWRTLSENTSSAYVEANWADGFPKPEHRCLFLAANGLQTSDCLGSMVGGGVLRCFCSTAGGVVSAERAAEVDAILQQMYSERTALAATWFTVVVVLSMLPLAGFLFRLRMVRAKASMATAAAAVAGEAAAAAAGAETQQAKALHSAKVAATSLRVRVSGTLLQAGLSSFAIAGLTFFSRVDYSPIIGTTSFWHILFPLAAALINLAMFPTDGAVVRFACYLWFSLFIAVTAANANALNSVLQTGGESSRTFVYQHSIVIGSFSLSALGLAPALLPECLFPRFAMTSRRSLRRVWLTTRFGMGMLGVACLLPPLSIMATLDPVFISDYPAFQGIMAYSVGFLLYAVTMTPAVRGRVHRRLGALGANGDEQQQAAAIAALVGGAAPEKALQAARAHFRVLPLNQLAESDLASSADTGLHERTQHARLGECDAFLSHSWRDDGTAKYAALHEWMASSAVARGETGWGGTIWLDKACIDQSNIDASLAALPVFLSGCDHLLIVAGSTYVSRLWCVMEVYTFVKMGGASERIALKQISADALEALSRFDASRARCFHAKDRDKLLAVIEAGFGNLTPFNRVVRRLLAADHSAAKGLLVADGKSGAGSAVRRPGRSGDQVLPHQHVAVVPGPRAIHSSLQR